MRLLMVTGSDTALRTALCGAVPGAPRRGGLNAHVRARAYRTSGPFHHPNRTLLGHHVLPAGEYGEAAKGGTS